MKKIIALLSIISLCYSVAYCGDGDTKPFKRVYIGLSVVPDVSYRHLVPNAPANGNSSQDQSIITTENHQGSPQAGLNAQLKVGINLTRWLAVESGVGYMLAQYKYQASGPATLGTSWNGSSYALPDSVTYKEKEIYHYMTVPIGLRFSIGRRTVRGIIAAGANLDFLLKQKEVTTFSDASGQISSNTTVDQTKNFNTFNVSPYLGVGIDCYLSKVFVLRLMPEAQIQSLKNINQPISEYLWNVGLDVSFLFGL